MSAEVKGKVVAPLARPVLSNRSIMNYDHVRDFLNVETSHLKPSVAIPDEDWTIPELLKYYQQNGVAPDLSEASDEEQAAYDFDAPDLEKFRQMDLVDQQTVIDNATAILTGYQKAKAAAEVKEREESEKRSFDAAVELKVAERVSKKKPAEPA